jgi:23S rRNA (cytidine1920-2'-O)/16S rRNA (cytidine1409-2'-O)-methyltransferase
LRKTRLDQYLVDKGLVPTRTKAQALIMAGQVKIDGHAVLKVGTPVTVHHKVELEAPQKYVSRGGFKLEGALADFGVSPKGLTCLDVGSSTGGFTDCLLQHGASHVFAIDVGTAQLDDSLKKDKRVDSREELHILDVKPADLNPRPSLAVIDVSFISIKRILPHVMTLLTRPAQILAMVKPQFEVGPQKLKKGVVRSEVHQKEAVDEVIEFSKGLGIEVAGMSPAKLKGPKGNQEYFLHLKLL